MVLLVEAAWNLATVTVLGLALAYSYKVYQTFKGSKLSRAYTYLLLAFGVMFGAFLLKLIFNFVEFEPIEVLYVSIRNSGVLLAAVLLVLSVRELAKFWTVKKSET